MSQGVPVTTESLACGLCNRTYAARSSYIRHVGQCGVNRNFTPKRQKACRQCVKAKTRCDNAQPYCSRCMTRKFLCEYPRSAVKTILELRPLEGGNVRGFENGVYKLGSEGNEMDGLIRQARMHSNIDPLLDSISSKESQRETPSEDISSERNSVQPHTESFVGLVSNSMEVSPAPNQDINIIHDRWLWPYVADAPPEIVSVGESTALVIRVFRTWPRMMARREQLPPIFHSTQMPADHTPLILANCFTLAKMWEGSIGLRGDLVEETIKREMNRLFDEYLTYDESTLLLAFQALLIYSIILLFPMPQKPSPCTLSQSTLVAVQNVAHHIFSTGLILPEEASHTLPSWQSWTRISAKRRTLVSLYCFEWMYLKLNNISTYSCIELKELYVPAGKETWGARSEKEWVRAYQGWLERWRNGGPYMMYEIFEEVGRGDVNADERGERWLADVDEFGMMFANSLCVVK